MSTVLEQIVARTRERLRDEPKPDKRAAEEMAALRTAHAFRAAIRNESHASNGAPANGAQTLLSVPSSSRDQQRKAQTGVSVLQEADAARANVIAEIKSASPSAGSIVDDPEVESIAADYARGGAAAISVVTEPEFFRGSRDWLLRARTAGLPVIMKDFVVEPSQLLRGIAAGADAILLLASLLDAKQIRDYIALLDAYGCDALVEVHDEVELERAVGGGAKLIGVNNRDLRTFRVDLATSERLGALMPADVVRVAESGIVSRADVERLQSAGFDAFLVGESLLRQDDRARAVSALVKGERP